MRTKFRLALAAVAVGALTVATAAPAGAQEEPETLGFAVDKTQASPGTLVLGKANAADVAEHCTTDLEEFQARFEELVNLLIDTEGPLFERFYTGDEFVFENHDQLAYSLTGLVGFGISFDDEIAGGALPQTFVMTFADIATQEPVGEMGNFDPDTGDGSVVVPDIEPGNWAVAAACVGPSTDLDVLEAGIRANGDFLEEIGAPVNPNTPEFQEFVREFLDDEDANLIDDFLPAIGPQLVENIVTPDAFGAVIFCIFDEQGVCPGPPPPPPGLDEDDVKDMTPPAQPVVAAPSFTG